MKEGDYWGILPHFVLLLYICNRQHTRWDLLGTLQYFTTSSSFQRVLVKTAFKHYCCFLDKFVKVATRCRKVVQYALYKLTFKLPKLLHCLNFKIFALDPGTGGCQVRLCYSLQSTLSIGEETIRWSVCFNIKTVSCWRYSLWLLLKV